MDAALVTAWKASCQELAGAFTGPTFSNFLLIATGWVLCQSRPTVTNLVRAIGENLLGHAVKHWTVYERFFYRAAWSLETLSRLLLTRIVVPLLEREACEGPGAPITLILDGTTCARTGKHVAFAGYFKDASTGNTLKTVIHWSHQWLIGAVALRPRRWPMWVTALPVFFALYRKKPDCNRRHPFATIQQLAAGMFRQAREALPEWVIYVVADGQFASRDVVEELDGRSALVSRLRRDAALYALPPTRRQRRPGRPRTRGKRLPSPKRMARRRKGWQTVWVRKGDRFVKRTILSIVCLWYHVCRQRPIRLVIVRDPSGHEHDDFLFCTDPGVKAKEIAERYFARWPIEESIRDGKQLNGFEQVQGWCPHTVQRQAPMALVVQTLVKAWFLRHGVRARAAQPRGSAACPWMPTKSHPSYLDMLATLRGVLWDSRINTNSTLRTGLKKILRPLRFALCGAL